MDYQELTEKMKNASQISYSQLNHIPPICGVYTAWLKGNEHCLYVGKSTALKKRISSHYGGQRGSDQFCLYIYDKFLHIKRPNGMNTAQVNKLTAEWIQENVSFKYVEIPESEISSFETHLRKLWKPILNPI